jgi:hypothetical protein
MAAPLSSAELYDLNVQPQWLPWRRLGSLRAASGEWDSAVEELNTALDRTREDEVEPEESA